MNKLFRDYEGLERSGGSPLPIDQQQDLFKQSLAYFQKAFPLGHSSKIEIVNAYIAGRKTCVFDKKQVASDAWDAAVQREFWNLSEEGSDMPEPINKQTYINNLP